MFKLPPALKPVLRFCHRVRLNVEHRLRFPLTTNELFVNKVEMRVFGLRRSGNHAITNWVFLNYPGTVCYLNNIRIDRHFNPYLSFGQSFLKSEGEVINYSPQRWLRKVGLTRQWHIQHPHKDCLIYSYEDQSLATLSGGTLEDQHDDCIGKSGKVLNIMVLRDPFNCFASRLQQYQVVEPHTVARWKEYAREFLAESEYLQPNRISISYNRWCHDAEYRRSLANQLGLVNSEHGVDQVPNVGRGSSFDETAFDGKAQAMRTGERWRKFADNPSFRSIFADRELTDLSERIFGPLEGTNTLLA